jgi:hypothetical protein
MADSRVRPAQQDDLQHIVRLFRDNVLSEYHDPSEYGAAVLSDVVRRHAFSSRERSVQSYVIEDCNTKTILGQSLIISLWQAHASPPTAYASVKEEPCLINPAQASHELIDLVVPRWHEPHVSMIMDHLKYQYQRHGLWVRLRRERGLRRRWRKLEFRVLGELQVESLGNEVCYIMSWHTNDIRLPPINSPPPITHHLPLPVALTQPLA